MSESTIELFDTLAKVLLRCWIFGFALLLVWFGFYMLLGDVIHGLHGEMFGLSKHDLNLIHYAGMGLVKLLVFVFFLFPWLSIKLVLWKEKL